MPRLAIQFAFCSRLHINLEVGQLGPVEILGSVIEEGLESAAVGHFAWPSGYTNSFRCMECFTSGSLLGHHLDRPISSQSGIPLGTFVGAVVVRSNSALVEAERCLQQEEEESVRKNTALKL